MKPENDSEIEKAFLEVNGLDKISLNLPLVFNNYMGFRAAWLFLKGKTQDQPTQTSNVNEKRYLFIREYFAKEEEIEALISKYGLIDQVETPKELDEMIDKLIYLRGEPTKGEVPIES